MAGDLEAWVKLVTVTLARVVEGVAAVVIAVGALRAFLVFAMSMGTRGVPVRPPSTIRLALGRSLALALEFLLAADILKTAVAPTWNDIGQLAAIAALRTALNYFLENELRAGEQLPAPARIPPS